MAIVTTACQNDTNSHDCLSQGADPDWEIDGTSLGWIAKTSVFAGLQDLASASRFYCCFRHRCPCQARRRVSAVRPGRLDRRSGRRGGSVAAAALP